MKRFSVLFSTALMALSLASCSKESYTFHQSEAYHHSTTSIVLTTPATTAEVTTAPELTASIATAAVAVPKAPHTFVARVKTPAPTAVATAKATTSEVKVTKATVKEMRKAMKAAKAAPTAAGKSQIVAALLCFFLGGLGIHDFYLGYIGKGILQIFLSLIFIGFILVIIDFVRILTGSLKPKNGHYSQRI